MIDLMSLFVGHVVGDYVIQTHNMAMRKTFSSKWCAFHCATYAACIAFAVAHSVSFWFVAWLVAFATHYPIDRYSLAAKFIQWKGGPDVNNMFFPIIYVILDNGTHLLLMWWILGTLI